MKWLALVIALVCTAADQETHYFFVFLNSKSDKKALSKQETDKIMEGHMANIQRLAKEGKLIAAGPFEGGGGLFIFKAYDIEQTKAWLSTDPGVKAERWNVEVFPFYPTIGSVCVAKEPYEMLMYGFVRYQRDTYAGKDSVNTLQLHADYLKSLAVDGEVIAAGNFPGGGILVLRQKADSIKIEADPAVKRGFYKPRYKQLYIAKGSFCEN